MKRNVFYGALLVLLLGFLVRENRLIHIPKQVEKTEESAEWQPEWYEQMAEEINDSLITLEAWKLENVAGRAVYDTVWDAAGRAFLCGASIRWKPACDGARQYSCGDDGRKPGTFAWGGEPDDCSSPRVGKWNPVCAA